MSLPWSNLVLLATNMTSEKQWVSPATGVAGVATPNGSAIPSRSNIGSIDQDEATMAEIGKVQQFKRSFGFWTTLAFTASLMCTWEAVFFANLTAMVNGGPPTLVYGFIYAVFGALSTAASLAEMASMYPTSGGQYHWCAMLAPEKQKVFLSWFVGW